MGGPLSISLTGIISKPGDVPSNPEKPRGVQEPPGHSRVTVNTLMAHKSIPLSPKYSVKVFTGINSIDGVSIVVKQRSTRLSSVIQGDNESKTVFPRELGAQTRLLRRDDDAPSDV